MTAQALCDCRHGRVQVYWVDLIEHIDQGLEQRVGFQLHRLSLDYRAGAQRRTGRLLRRKEFHRLRAEHCCAGDTHGRIRRDVAHLATVDRERQRRLVTGIRDVFDLADLDTAVLDLGVAVHHQTCSRRGHRHGLGRGERGGVREIGEHRERHDDRRQHCGGDPDRGSPRHDALLSPLARQIEVTGRAVHAQGNEQGNDDHDDQRRPDRLTHSDAHADGSAGCVVTVVGMHQHHRDRHHNGLSERPQ